MRPLSRCGFAALGTLLVASACSSFQSTTPDATRDAGGPDGSPMQSGADASEAEAAAPVDGSVTAPDAMTEADSGFDAGVPCTTTCRSHGCDDDGGCHPLVFVTQERFNGTFDSTADAGAPAYGIIRGDYVCNAIAGDGGTSFVALLSTTNVDALTRITVGNGAYRPVLRADHTIVASSYHTLFQTNPLDAGINLTNLGAEVATEQHVWTGTNTMGTASGHTCGDWTDTFNGTLGDVGFVNELNGAWVTAPTVDSCNTLNHLYCAEIVP